MKKLKLFPKTFIYTLALLLLITMLASGTIYLLAPMMGENSVLSEGTYVDGMSSAIKTAAIPRNSSGITTHVPMNFPIHIPINKHKNVGTMTLIPNWEIRARFLYALCFLSAMSSLHLIKAYWNYYTISPIESLLNN